MVNCIIAQKNGSFGHKLKKGKGRKNNNNIKNIENIDNRLKLENKKLEE